MTINKIALTILASVFSVQVSAAVFVIQNNDGAGEGFNDPNPPVHANQKGNNPGTSLGEMRLKVFEEAAKVWGTILNSNITINVGAEFNELGCSAGGGTLGSAGSAGSSANFAGSDPNITYPIALAESLKNENINGASVEINATFNSKVDTNDPDCLGGGGFYYGLDGNNPAGTSDLFPVVLHELGHGLGFSSFAQVSPAGSGGWSGSGGHPDAYSRNLLDLDTGKSWVNMTNAERKASALNEPALVWTGAKATADRGMHLGPAPELEINAPAGIAGIFSAVLGDEPSIVIPENGVTAGVLDGNTFEDMVFSDPGDPKEDPFEGCTQAAFAQIFAGKIVLFDESTNCSALVQAFFAEFAGALGLIIVSTADSGLPDVSGQIGNQDIIMPYIGVEKSVGAALRANLGAANVTIRNSVTTLQGENQGKVKMFAPAVYNQGSSVSHWSSTASPDLLMEPSLGNLDFADVDLTAAAFQDVGWSVNIPGGVVELIYKDGFE